MKKSDWKYLLGNAAQHRFWLLTGLETISLGLFFYSTPGYIRDGSPFHSAVNFLDDPLPVLVLLTVGFFTVVTSCFDMRPDLHRLNVVALQFIWTVYAAAFLIHDLNDPMGAHIGIVTILFWAIVVRIFVESLVSEPSDKDLERDEARRTSNLSKLS